MNNREIAERLEQAARAVRHGRHTTAIKALREVISNYLLNDGERAAVDWATDLVYDDQMNYMATGTYSTDYGSEWPEVLNTKIDNFRLLASALRNLGGPYRHLESAAQQLENLRENEAQ